MEGHQLADGRANGALRLSDSHGRVEGVEPGRKGDIGTITFYNVCISLCICYSSNMEHHINMYITMYTIYIYV